MSGACLTSTQNVRLCGKPVSRADGQLTVHNGGSSACPAGTLSR
jgi:hypothetical protein